MVVCSNRRIFRTMKFDKPSETTRRRGASLGLEARLQAMFSGKRTLLRLPGGFFFNTGYFKILHPDFNGMC